MITALTLAVVVVFIGSVTGSAWFFLKPGGLTERLVQKEAESARYLLDSFTKLSEEVQILKTNQGLRDAATAELEAGLLRRIAAFESRYGKVSKQEEKERALAQIAAAAKQQTQLNGGL